MSENQQTTRQTIQLEGGKPWGFRIVGGSDLNVPLQIQLVLSAKAKESGLMKEDKIVEINGTATSSLSHNDVKKLIGDSGTTLKLVIERDSSKSSTSEYQSGRGMSSVPSKSSVSPPPEKIKSSSVTPPKAEIKPRVHLNEDAPRENLKQDNSKLYEKTEKQTEQEKANFNKDVGEISSSEIKSPFLKNLVTTGGDRPPDQSSVQIKPPTATYTPTTKATPEKSKEKTSPEVVKPDNSISASTTMQEDLEKVCARCNELIKDTGYISASDKFYHKPHFSCSKCNNTLLGKAYFEDSDKNICCQQCVSKSGDGGSHCKICNKPIHGSFLTVGKDCYHDDCFTCFNCKKSLKSLPFIFSDDKPYCEGCNENINATYCVKCKKPIKAGESFVEVENGHCHSKCFTCKICKSVLTSFKMRDGYAICPKH